MRWRKGVKNCDVDNLARVEDRSSRSPEWCSCDSAASSLTCPSPLARAAGSSGRPRPPGCRRAAGPARAPRPAGRPRPARRPGAAAAPPRAHGCRPRRSGSGAIRVLRPARPALVGRGTRQYPQVLWVKPAIRVVVGRQIKQFPAAAGTVLVRCARRAPHAFWARAPRAWAAPPFGGSRQLLRRGEQAPHAHGGARTEAAAL